MAKLTDRKPKNALIITVKGEQKMMKKTYTEPEIEIVCFGSDDVVRTSGEWKDGEGEMIEKDIF